MEAPSHQDSGLPAFFPRSLAEAARPVALEKGERLFRQGDPARSLYFVLEGEVVAIRHLRDRSDAVMMRAAAGELCAESTVAITRYSCDAICSRRSRVIEIPAAALRQVLATQTEFALSFVAALAAHSRRQCSRLERSRLKRARDRVLHYLVCELAPESVLSLETPLSAWAQELGFEPETLYRTLRESRPSNRLTPGKRVRPVLGALNPGECRW